MLNCAGAFPMLPGNMLQVENNLLNFYIAAQRGVSSAHTYFPHADSDSQEWCIAGLMLFCSMLVRVILCLVSGGSGQAVPQPYKGKGS